MARPRALSDEAIRRIQKLRKFRGAYKRGRGPKLATLAKRYDVSVPLISKVLSGKITYVKRETPCLPKDVRKRRPVKLTPTKKRKKATR